jgi:hypothetical protein
VLGEAAIPPGARVTETVRCRDLRESYADVPLGIAELIDLHRFYLVDRTPGVVGAYLRTHLPTGAVVTSTVGAGGCLAGGLGIALPVRGPHEYLAELTCSMAAVGGDATELRVDASSVWLPTRSGAERAPAQGVVTVTAYAEASSMNPSSGPVTFALSRGRAGSLVSVLNALPLGPSSYPLCLEDSLIFRIVVRPASGAPPSFQADGWDCGAVVRVTAHGRSMQPLYDGNCSLLRAVVKVLPAHAGEATREAGTECRLPATMVPAARSKIPASALTQLTQVGGVHGA